MSLVQQYHRLSRRWLVLGVSLVAILLMTGISLVAAQEAVQPDLRLNQVTHFGGDAIYCVDGDLNPTHQYSDFGDGGFRLLDKNGQVLWFVPATPTVHDATQQALATGEYTFVAEGQGTYGPVSLYTFLNGDGDVLFTFNGFDEWGKPNSMTFKYCEPVNPIPQHAPDDDGCWAIDLSIKVPDLDVQLAQQEPGTIPCEECPPPNVVFVFQGTKICTLDIIIDEGGNR
jgi:hypothetical protein